MAVGSEEAQADQQGGQEQAGDIHLWRPGRDREGRQASGRGVLARELALLLSLGWYSDPILQCPSGAGGPPRLRTGRGN